MSIEINVDIGGTFTDCYATDGDRVVTAKALTTRHNLAAGFLRALDELAAQLGLSQRDVLRRTSGIRYATTLGTNALIERDGQRLGMLTTAGYEDVVPIGRCRQWGDGLPPALTRGLASAERPVPLVPRENIAGLRERIDYSGQVCVPLREQDVRERVRQLADCGVRGFVVCLLWATANPAHEMLVRQVIEDEYPAACLGRFPIVLSHEVSGRSGEYVRSMTAIINAYLHRRTSDRLSQLRDELRDRGFTGPLLLVHNSGGMGSLAQTAPLQTVHAGPVAGVREHLLSPETAYRVYRVVADPDTFEVNDKATEQARRAERQARIGRGLPYEEFVTRWRRDEPPPEVPFLGGWAWQDRP